MVHDTMRYSYVWLAFRSKRFSLEAEIAEFLDVNIELLRHNLDRPRKYSHTAAVKLLLLESTKFLKENTSTSNHIQLMLDELKRIRVRAKEFLQMSDNTCELFVCISLRGEATYIELNPEALELLSDIGVKLVIKFEVDED